MVKAKNEIALNGVKMVFRTDDNALSLAAPVRTASVLFTDSFAVIPDNKAVEARQS